MREKGGERMEKEAVQTRILIGVALLLAAALFAYQAFFVPEVTRPVVVTVASDPASSSPAWPVDLNTADLEQLDTLPGVGPVTAQAIFDYREENGPFQSVDDLVNVYGIGEKTVEKLREYVVVS